MSELAAWDAIAIGWTWSGRLFARWPDALATFDRATGAVARRQCGWSFGFVDDLADPGGSMESICDAAR